MPQDICNCVECTEQRAEKAARNAVPTYTNVTGKGGKFVSRSGKKEATRVSSGEIKWYNRRFGYGFVRIGTVDLFFHHSAVVLEGFSSKTKLKGGLRVSVEYKGVQDKDVYKYRCMKVKITK